jgi:ATP/maltotriose-dependent transcriptional regulator MalT
MVDNFGQKQRAFEIAANAVADARASGDASTLAHALTVYARVASVTGRLDEMERALIEAETIPAPSAALRIALRETQAFLGLAKGDLEAAARAYDLQRQENRALGNARGELAAASNLAETEHYRGETRHAIAIVREAIAIARSGKHASLLASHLQNLANYLVALGELPEAVIAAREAIELRAAREPDHPMVSAVLETLALAHALRGDVARAASLEGYADRAFARHGYNREFTEAATCGRLTALLREQLSPGELARKFAEGAALQPEAAIALALATDLRAG